MSKSKDITKGVLKVLGEMADKGLSKEIIGGVAVGEVLEAVDLSIAFSPVVQHPVSDYEFNIPIPTKVRHWQDGRYVIVTTGKRPDFEVIPEDCLKIMRARFLLIHGFYYKCLAKETLSRPNKQKVLDLYFEGSVYIPQFLIDQYYAEDQQKNQT